MPYKLRYESYAYYGARRRCVDPTHNSYPRYGGRGIQFKFNSFDEFFAEVGPKPSPQHQIDRFPNGNGNYEKGNVRWATPKEQAANRLSRKGIPRKPFTIEHCANISAAKTGKHILGHPCSLENKAKLRAARLGTKHPHTLETIAKMRIKAKNRKRSSKTGLFL